MELYLPKAKGTLLAAEMVAGGGGHLGSWGLLLCCFMVYACCISEGDDVPLSQGL